MNAEKPFKLELCLIKPREYSIEFADGKVKVLQPKFIEVLVYLAAQFPRLVDRQELIEAIWDGNHFVGEKALTNAVWNLRNVLKKTDTAYIETVRKTGYRLLVEPQYLEQEVAQPPADDPQAKKLITIIKNSPYVGIAAVVAATSMVAASIMAVMFWLVFPDQSQQVHNQIVNMTDDPGREVYPVVSPDSRFLIYSWRRIGRQPNLYLKDLTGPSVAPKQLTFSEDYEGRVVWHPHGEKIYFQRKHWDYSLCHIIGLNLVTNEQKVITKCTGELDFSMTLSPDGNTLAFAHLNPTTARQSIHVIDLLNEGPATELYQCDNGCGYKDQDAAFSPDGKQLMISRTLNEGIKEEVFLFDLQSKQFTALSESAGDIKGLAWHPQSDRIVYSAQTSGLRDGYVVSIADKNTTRLNLPGFSYPRFMPHSNEVVFHHWQVLSHLSSLQLTDSTATAPFPLMQSDYSYHSPHYSEKNQKMVFVSNESGFEEIWIADIDGSNRQKLTSLKTHLTFPRWSHNGEYIAFLGPKAKNKRNALYVFNVKSRVGKKLDSQFEHHFRPSWLQDDSGLLAGASLNNKSSLYVFPINNQAPKLLLKKTVSFAIQGESGDIFYAPGRNRGLWRFSPDEADTKPEQLLGNDLFRVSYNWELGLYGIYFKHDYAQHHQINYYDFNSGKIASVVKLPTGTVQRVSSMTFIAQQNKIVFTRMEFPKVDIKRLSHELLK